MCEQNEIEKVRKKERCREIERKKKRKKIEGEKEMA